MRSEKQWIIMTVIILCSFVAASAQAGTVTLPNTFVAGQTAVAADVNENFNALADEINDNDDRIIINAEDIQNNADAIDGVSSKLGVRLTRINTKPVQGQVTPLSDDDWYFVCELGEFEKELDDSLIDLCYQAIVRIASDADNEYAMFRIYLHNIDNDIYYSSPDIIVVRDYDNFGTRYHTLVMNAAYSGPPAGTYEMNLNCKSTYQEVYVNAGYFESTCVIKEMPTPAQ